MAKDYAERISKAISISNESYTSLVSEQLLKDAGIQTESMLMCTATNATYTDCPISSDFRGDFVAVAHNPAAVT